MAARVYAPQWIARHRAEEPRGVRPAGQTRGQTRAQWSESRAMACVVAAGQGTRLKLLELQPEGRRAMTVRDFLAGHPTPIGTRLGSDPGSDPGQTPMTAPARRAAFQALVAIDADRADLPAALATSRASLSDDRDRALTATIVTGTLRWQRSLDHLIEHLRQTATDQARPAGPLNPPPESFPTAASRSRAGSRGRRRCGEPDASGA